MGTSQIKRSLGLSSVIFNRETFVYHFKKDNVLAQYNFLNV
jgi:hypothetical protein